MTYAISAWWGYATAADKQRLDAFIRRAVRAGLYTQQMDQTCVSWFLTGTKLSLHEYWRINIMYCDNCYQILPLTTMDYSTRQKAFTH